MAAPAFKGVDTNKLARIAMAKAVVAQLNAVAASATMLATADKYKAAAAVHQQALNAMQRNA